MRHDNHLLNARWADVQPCKAQPRKVTFTDMLLAALLVGAMIGSAWPLADDADAQPLTPSSTYVAPGGEHLGWSGQGRV